MLTDFYHKTALYLTATFGGNFIYFLIVFSTAFSVGYFILIGYTVTRMDKRYFIRDRIKGEKYSDDKVNNLLPTTPIRKCVLLVVQIFKIPLGICLLVSGIVMLVLPGQGLITILIGLGLLPFPYKHKIEQNLLSRKSVRSSLNWLRIKANKEPFIFD